MYTWISVKMGLYHYYTELSDQLQSLDKMYQIYFNMSDTAHLGESL